MIGAELLSSTSLTLGWLIYLPVLLWAIVRAPWVELFSDSRRQHLLFGTVFALFLLWLVRRDFDTGVSYHFIGMTAVTLLLDWPLAILGGLVAQVGLLLLGRQDLLAMGVNGALFILMPVPCHYDGGAPRRARQRAILCVLVAPGSRPRLSAMLFLSGYALVRRPVAMPEWIEDFIGYLWLIIFPEAFINGMVVSALVVFSPEWLETFNRTRYLSAPWKDDDPKS